MKIILVQKPETKTSQWGEEVKGQIRDKAEKLDYYSCPSGSRL